MEQLQAALQQVQAALSHASPAVVDTLSHRLLEVGAQLAALRESARAGEAVSAGR